MCIKSSSRETDAHRELMGKRTETDEALGETIQLWRRLSGLFE